MKKIALLITIITLYINPIYSQLTVTPAKKATSNHGFFYALPQTVINIDVEIEKREFYSGPFAEYASELMGIRSVNTKDNTSYRIANITMSTSSESDPDQFYFVSFTPEDVRKGQSFYISLDESGLLSSANMVNKKSKKRSKKSVSPILETLERNNIFDFQDIESTQNILDTTIIKIRVDTATFSDISLSHKTVLLSNKDQAKLTKEKIDRLQKDRYALSAGYQEMAYSEGTIKYMDQRLKEQYDNYMSLFVGKTIISNQTFSTEYIPEKSRKNLKETIFKFSSSSGIRHGKSSSGKPITITITPENTTENIKGQTEKMLDSPPKSHGIYYRIPEMAYIEITFEDKLLYRQRISINQLGVESFLPYSDDLKIELDSETGNIKKLLIHHYD